MPNGKGSPDCHICSFYHPGGEVNRCGKHDFFIPTLGHEKLCSDWEHHEYKFHKPFPGLKPGILYYYTYVSSQVKEPLYSFDQLNQPLTLLSVPVWEDSEYGWVLYLHKDQFKYFPEPDCSFQMRMEDSPKTFSIVDVKRTFSLGGTRTEQEKAKAGLHGKFERIIYCPSSPNVLYNWLNGFFDMDAYLEKYQRVFREYFISPHISLLVQIGTGEDKYKLRPDLHLYGEFGRGSFKRGQHSQRWRLLKWFQVLLTSGKARKNFWKVVPELIRQWVKWKLKSISRRF